MGQENQKTILFVAIAFPPKLDPEAIQVARYFKYMAAENVCHIDVVTSGDTLWMAEDPKLKHYTTGARQIVKVPITEPKYISIVINKLFRPLFQLPDTRLSFYLRWKRAAREIKERPSLVYARGFPLSSILMGYKLAKHYAVPLIMHLSDPWSDSPILNFRGISLWFQKKWQKKCFSYAKWITVASPRMLSFYREKYPEYRDKFVYMPNVYDPNDIVSSPPTSANTKLSFVYTGSLNGSRQPLPFMQALARIYQRNPGVAAELEVHMVGPFDKTAIGQINDANLPFVHNHGQVSFSESQEWQRKSDVLVIIDSDEDDPNKALFFPSKILDYLVARKPILSITPSHSTTREILAGENFHHFSHNEVDRIAACIEELLHEKDKVQNPSDQPVDEIYSAGYNAKRLLTLIQQA